MYGRKHTDGSRSGGQEPLRQIENDETSHMIEQFSRAFDRPVNVLPTTPCVTDRLLLGKLLLEETLEYVTKGLGLRVAVDMDPRLKTDEQYMSITHEEGCFYDVIEAADGLADVNVIIHFNALWEGIPLREVTNEIHRSNMSKLDESGHPILNGVTWGYRDSEAMEAYDGNTYAETGFDPTKPVGKILKGPNYSPPNLYPILGLDIPEEEE